MNENESTNQTNLRPVASPRKDPKSASRMAAGNAGGTGAVPMLPFGRVIEFVAEHPGCTVRDVTVALLGDGTKKSDDRKRADYILRSLAYAGLLIRQLTPVDGSDSGQYLFWTADLDADQLAVGWRLRAVGAETLRANAEAERDSMLDRAVAAEAEAKRWRARCPVEREDAIAAGLDGDPLQIFRKMAAWCSAIGIDPLALVQEAAEATGTHEVVNGLAAKARRSPHDVLAEIVAAEVPGLEVAVDHAERGER